MKALILSGGTGTRLRPLTYTNAKQLIPVANKPILYYIIEKISKVGIEDVGIIVGDTHQEIKIAVGNGNRWGIRTTFIHQPFPLGLAHAVKTASSFIGDSDFIMILGDNLFQMELDEIINNFYLNNSNASLLLHRVDNPSEFGVAVVENGRIVKLVEKPEDFISDLIVTGVYVFDKSIFNAISHINPSPRGELEITDAIQKLLEMGGKVSYTLTSGWWKDTGKICDVLEANRLILDSPDGIAGSSCVLGTLFNNRIHMGQNVTVENSVIQGPAVIGDDAVITGSCIGPYTSVGKRVEIINSHIENSIVLDNTKVENIGKKISGSLIGKNVTIKNSKSGQDSLSFLLGDDSKIAM
ncbi:MAG: glucose-1-phosphate thymidylyltransferase [Clostridiales bacterium]|jgi:glucose-1-phosphate thymidylyltransferase|nr:glucose-1-phosphate thymidylyltransferase [Eubacteriales bacterium]MDH7567680.1 glucose-1-phosphate thymidylyltransferase [Clostridiales bacterium]